MMDVIHIYKRGGLVLNAYLHIYMNVMTYSEIRMAPSWNRYFRWNGVSRVICEWRYIYIYMQTRISSLKGANFTRAADRLSKNLLNGFRTGLVLRKRFAPRRSIWIIEPINYALFASGDAGTTKRNDGLRLSKHMHKSIYECVCDGFWTWDFRTQHTDIFIA